MIVSDVLNRVRPVLNDSDSANYRWSDSDLKRYIDDAVRLILTKRPDANSVTTTITLAVGYQQTLDDAHEKLIDVIANGAGRAVTIIDQAVLDSFSPNWRNSSANDATKHYMYDPRVSREYQVYPPVKTTAATLKAKVALKHSSLAESNANIGLRDSYMEHVVCFVLYKAYARDMEFAGNAELAGSYLAMFNGMLGDKTMADNAFAPAMNRKGDQPHAPAQQIGGV